MIQGMTGFGSKEAEISQIGRVGVELRSTNHKFFELAFHLPEEFLYLEDRIKKGIGTKIKRGRVTCNIVLKTSKALEITINQGLLKNYISSIKKIKDRFRIQDELNLNTIINLPGVLSMAGTKISQERVWPRLQILVAQALDSVVSMRKKEGRALYFYLKSRAQEINKDLEVIKRQFAKLIKEKCLKITTDEERSSFLKEVDISEEIERLAFHVRSFKNKLSQSGPIGKELDFMAQEMQREINTIGAKSCSTAISAKVVQVKSQIEKIREQVQNIE